jgi:hypothetical protein
VTALMRTSATVLEAFRLWSDPEQEWMSPEQLHAQIRGEFTATRMELGTAFDRVLERPVDHYHVEDDTYVRGAYVFPASVVSEALKHIPEGAVPQVKWERRYGDVVVVAKVDHIHGLHIYEHKVPLHGFDVEKYANSYQWRYMLDVLSEPDTERGPNIVTYNVFHLREDRDGTIRLKDVDTVDFYRYPELHADCVRLLDRFTEYVTSQGLDQFLREKQAEAEAR